MNIVVLKRELAAELFGQAADMSASAPADQPDLCEGVNAVAQAHSLGFDCAWVTRKRGGYADTWRARHDEGCEIIAMALIKDRVPVF
ncbi:hypothetical protein [Bradyrhizobium sp. 1200_D9_N1_1]|uniref:hypothetical protein n=1 Tax=Bradyrhizobium sp. 1200_D9_N1_1 TaxID=3239013 RepID=UPI003F8B851A